MPITRTPLYVTEEDGSVSNFDDVRRSREEFTENQPWAKRVPPTTETRDTMDAGRFGKGADMNANPNMLQLTPEGMKRREELEGVIDYHVGREVSFQVGRTHMDFFDADRDMGRNGLRRVEVVEVDDSGPIQKVIVMGLADEYFEMPLRGQQHGMTGNPRKGAVGYVMMANGRPDQAFLMGLEHPDDRKKDIEPGETKTYGSAGQEIHHDKDGNIIIKTPGICHINPP